MNGHHHAGDALSGLLDGQLEPAEEAAVRAHLAECAACGQELAAVREARSLLRALPPVEPPFGLYERVLLRSRRLRGVAAVVTAAAASVSLLAFADPQPSPVRPEVADLVNVHAGASSATGDPVSQLAPAGVPVSTAP